MDADRISEEDLELLVETWVRHAALRKPGDVWAWDRANALVRGSAEDGWKLVKELIDAAPEEMLGGVAVGPLELLVHQHGAALIDRLEARATRDNRFRECLAQIWLRRGAVPETIEARLQQVTGNRILVDELDAEEDI